METIIPDPSSDISPSDSLPPPPKRQKQNMAPMATAVDEEVETPITVAPAFPHPIAKRYGSRIIVSWVPSLLGCVVKICLSISINDDPSYESFRNTFQPLFHR